MVLYLGSRDTYIFIQDVRIRSNVQNDYMNESQGYSVHRNRHHSSVSSATGNGEAHSPHDEVQTMVPYGCIFPCVVSLILWSCVVW